MSYLPQYRHDEIYCPRDSMCALFLAIIEKAFEDTESRSADICEEAYDFLYNDAYLLISWILK